MVRYQLFLLQSLQISYKFLVASSAKAVKSVVNAFNKFICFEPESIRGCWSVTLRLESHCWRVEVPLFKNAQADKQNCDTAVILNIACVCETAIFCKWTQSCKYFLKWGLLLLQGVKCFLIPALNVKGIFHHFNSIFCLFEIFTHYLVRTCFQESSMQKRKYFL